MAASVTCPAWFWTGGMTWTALASRRIPGSLATADAGTAAAVGPLGGVITGPATGLQVTAGTGMTVNVAAGYCAIPHPTAGQGTYLTGLMTQATLTLAAADPSHPRIDVVIARITDAGSPSSSSDVEVVTGTPASSPVPPTVTGTWLLLAQVAVPAAATSPGTITDKRVWTGPPGGILPVASAAAAPAVPPSQMLYDEALGKLCRGSGTAGAVLGAGSGSAPVESVVNTSSGATGLSPGGPGLPWGIGAGAYNVSYSTDRYPAAQITQTWDADGVSDYEIVCKWQAGFGLDLWIARGGITAGQIAYQLLVDGAVVDETDVFVADGTVASGGAVSWFTAGPLGTRPGRGPHTATLAVMTTGTAGAYSSGGRTYYVSGVMIGDLHDSAVRVFGVPPGWAAALVAENCYVTVAQVPA